MVGSDLAVGFAGNDATGVVLLPATNAIPTSAVTTKGLPYFAR